jgi:hypothetical protein
MKMKEPLFCRILKYALYAIFILGVIGTIALPAIMSWLFNFAPAYRAFILPFLMSLSIPSLWIVLEMIWMMRSIPKGPFVKRNVRALYRIGVLFLVLSASFTFKCFMFLTFLTVFCAFFFLMGGLFAFTLAALIHQSVVLQEENDLMI